MTPIIRTFSGKIVNPLDLKIEDIYIEDIAHALSQTNRFNGHTRRAINVAQHSVYCARICSTTPYALQALLHDASEAYLGDVTKWLKHSPEMLAFREAEDRAQKLIYERFNCPTSQTMEVDYADRIMVRFEGIKGFGKNFIVDHPDYPKLTESEKHLVGPWGFWSSKISKESFLIHFEMYGGKR